MDKKRKKIPNDGQLESATKQNCNCTDSCCLLKKLALKKVLLGLAVIQILGIWYVYRSSIFFWGKSTESSPHADALATNHIVRSAGSVFHLPLTSPADMSQYYVEVETDVWCLTIGSKPSVSGKCVCLDGWNGADCGVPPSIWDSGFLKKGQAVAIKIQRRFQPRRLISSLWYTGDLDAFNHTLHRLNDAVDVFIVGELNKTSNSSSRKSELRSLNLSHKMVVISIPESPDNSNPSLWVQRQIWDKARKILSDLRPDDIVIMSDDTSIPLVETLTFLKLYEGFSEPIFFHVVTVETRSIFLNYSNVNVSKNATVHLSPNISACTFEFMRSVCSYDAQIVWVFEHPQYKDKVKRFQEHNWKANRWYVGSKDTPAAVNYNPKEIISTTNTTTTTTTTVSSVENVTNV